MDYYDYGAELTNIVRAQTSKIFADKYISANFTFTLVNAVKLLDIAELILFEIH